VVEALWHRYLGEGLHELGHLNGVDVGICHLVYGSPEDLFLELICRKFRMVHAERSRGKEGVKIQPLFSGSRIYNPTSLRFFHIDDYVKAVAKDPPLQHRKKPLLG